MRVGVGDRLALGAPPPRRRRGRGARRPTSRAAPAPTPTAPPDRTPTPPPPLPQRGRAEARTSRRAARPAPQAERRMGRRRERRIERRARRRLRPRQRGGAAAASRGRRPSPARCSQKPPPRRRLQWQGGPQWPRGRERPPPTRRPASLHRQLTKEWGRSRARGRPSHAHPAASRTAPSCPRGALARAHSCGLGKGRGTRAAAFRRGRPMSHRQKQRRPTGQGRAGTIRRRGICLAAFPRAPGVWRRGGKTGRHGMSPRLYISCRQWLEAADKNRGFSDRGRGRAAGGP